jgi:WD40 repeat protein
MNKLTGFVLLSILISLFNIEVLANPSPEPIAEYSEEGIREILWLSNSELVMQSGQKTWIQDILSTEQKIIGESSDLFPINMAVNNDASLIAVVAPNGEIFLIDLITMNPIHTFQTDWPFVMDITFYQDTLMAVSADSVYSQWDMNTSNLLAQESLAISKPPLGQAFFNNSANAVAIFDENMWSEPQEIMLWNTATNNIERSLILENYPAPADEYHEYQIYEAIFSDDDTWLAVSRSDRGILQLWQLQEPLGAYRFEDDLLDIQALAISPNNSLLAIAQLDGQIQIFDMDCIVFDNASYANCLLYSWLAHEDAVFSLDFNQDGSLLASSGLDSKVKIWCINP